LQERACARWPAASIASRAGRYNRTALRRSAPARDHSHIAFQNGYSFARATIPARIGFPMM
jgi:hypothetical protein